MKQTSHRVTVARRNMRSKDIYRHTPITNHVRNGINGFKEDTLSWRTAEDYWRVQTVS